MALNVFYPENIRSALLAAEQATVTAQPDSRYLEGYRAALLTIALAFGLVGDNDGQAGLPRLADNRPVLPAMFLTMR